MNPYESLYEFMTLHTLKIFFNHYLLTTYSYLKLDLNEVQL